MSPIDWALRPLKRYADFSGRAPRAEYWWYALAVGIVGLLLSVIDASLLHLRVWGTHGPFGLAFVLGVAVPGFAVLVRRLHDTGRSGWWALVRLPSYGLLISGSSVASLSLWARHSSALDAVGVLVLVFGWLIAELVVFVLAISAGTEGSNRFGPDPYGGHDDLEEVFA